MPSASLSPSLPSSENTALWVGGFGLEYRYARALFQLAQESDRLPAIASDIGALAHAINVTPDFLAFLKNDSLDKEDKITAMKKIMIQLATHPITQNFIDLVIEKGRADQLSKIMAAFQLMMDAHQAVQHIHIHSAVSLNAAYKEKLTQICRQHFGERCDIHFSVDSNLKGGIKLSLSDYVIDASLRGKLTQMKDRFRRYFQTA